MREGLHDYDEINSRLSEQSCTGHFSEQSRMTAYMITMK